MAAAVLAAVGIGVGAAAAVGATTILAAVAAGASVQPPGGPLTAAPAEYRAAITAAAAGCGLPPQILAAQLQTESNWDPGAVSPAGAQGLAQFMPGTWATWGRDADGDGDASPFDPLDAIDAQGRFMCSLYAAAGSSGIPGDPIDLALAGYNAGWGAVQRYRGVPPYRETQAYVARIRALAEVSQPTGEVVWPLDDPDPITNAYGDKPAGIRYAAGYHTGIDLNADGRLGRDDKGQPIRAARDGQIAAIWPDDSRRALGNELVIAHPDGWYTSYGHLLGFAPGIRAGDRVTAGQVVGALGCSGMHNSCGPHLHFEVRNSLTWAVGSHQDPMRWLGLPPPQ